MSARRIRRVHARQIEREESRERRLGAKARLAAAGATIGATVLFAPAAQAATFQVTETNDENDGADACESNPTDCSLREAALDANDSPDADTITFAADVTGDIQLTLGPIGIYNGPVAIQGPGASLLSVLGDADNNRIFKLLGFDAAGSDVTISGLTLADGYVDYDAGGGALYSVPAAGYAADLTVANSVLTNNVADSNFYDNDGGAIKALYGSLTITGSTLSDNYSYAEGGAVYTDEATLAISGSTFSGNAADDEGGGVSVQDTPGAAATEVTIADSVVADNDVYDDEGGGIYLDNVDAAALIERTTVEGNYAGDEGGGIYVDSDNDAPVTISSSTVSGNSVDTDEEGGGIAIDSTDYAVVVQNTTVSGNSAEVGGGLYTDADEGNYDYGDDVTIRNSTIAQNEASDTGGGIYRGSYTDYSGFYSGDELKLSSTIVADNTNGDLAEYDNFDPGEEAAFTTGFSLIESATNATLNQSPAGTNLLGVDPQLGALAANGGPTQTHRPAASSPAIDAGVANGLANDQRGQPRTFDPVAVANRPGSDGTDIGSVEVQAGEGGLLGNATCQGVLVAKRDGTAGNDTITGTDAAEAIFGLGGNDALDGAGGNDCVNGDEGKDNAKGGPGKDIVKGGSGADRGSGGGGKDKVKGNAGKDKLKGGGGGDRLSGGGGKDNLKGGGGKDRLKGGPGKDRISGGGGKDRINCGGGEDKVTAQEKDKVSQNCEKVVERA